MYRVTDLTPLARGGGAGVPANTSQQRPLTERGTVAVAPTSESDRMVVVTTSSSKDYGVEVPAGNWSPRGTALPTLGAECLVVFDDVGDAFVPTWAGVTTTFVPSRAQRKGALSFGAGAFTYIPMDTVTPGDDPNGHFDLADGWYVVPATGWYHIDAQMDFVASGAGTDILLSLSTQGGAEKARGARIVATGASQLVSPTIACKLPLVAGDELKLSLFTAPAGTLQNTVPYAQNYMDVTRVS